MKTQPLPPDVVTEFLGSVELKGSDERQIFVSEQIASQTYNTMDDLVDTVKGYVKNQQRYERHIEKIKTNPFYQKYFFKEQVTQAVIEDMASSDPGDCV
jgi:hypothetical protein